MTRQELHQISSFATLFVDPRFVAALTYLRANFKNQKSAEAGEWRGYYGAMDDLEALRFPQSKTEAPGPKAAPYTKPESSNL